MRSSIAEQRRDIPAVLHQGIAWHRCGRLRKAQSVYRQVLRAQPGDAEAMHLLGLSLHHGGQSARAAELIERAIAAAPEVAAYRNHLGDCYRQLGRLDEAIEQLRNAVGCDCSYARAHYNLADLYAQLDRCAEAEWHWQEAQRLNPKSKSLADPLLDFAKLESARRHACSRSIQLASLRMTHDRQQIGPDALNLEALVSGPGLNVVFTDHLIVPDGQTIELRGASDGALVVNVRGDFFLGEHAQVQLAGGILASRVLWNIPPCVEPSQPNFRQICMGRDALLEGTLLAPDRFVFCRGTIRGNLIALANCSGPVKIETNSQSAQHQSIAAGWTAAADSDDFFHRPSNSAAETSLDVAALDQVMRHLGGHYAEPAADIDAFFQSLGGPLN